MRPERLIPPPLPPEAAALAMHGAVGPWRRTLSRRLGSWALGGVEALLPAPACAPVDWTQVRRVAVLRLDHLGDLLMTFPALAALRRGLPQGRIELFVGPWGAELGRLCPDVDAVHVVEAPWFRRPQPQRLPLGAILGLGRSLRRGRYDLGLEFRGDLRQLAALWASGIPLRMGHALTHGRNLLTHVGNWAPRHEAEQSLELLRQFGLPQAPAPGRARPRLTLPASARAEARVWMKAAGLKPGFWGLHPSAGSRSRLWPQEHWVALLKALPRGRQLALLGVASERPFLEELKAASGRPGIVVAAGDTSVAGLAALLKEASLFIGLNSGPGHLAAAVGTRTLSLFSSANDPARWGALGPQVSILRVPVPCSPCELGDCPYGNACMQALKPAAALAAATALAARR